MTLAQDLKKLYLTIIHLGDDMDLPPYQRAFFRTFLSWAAILIFTLAAWLFSTGIILLWTKLPWLLGGIFLFDWANFWYREHQFQKRLDRFTDRLATTMSQNAGLPTEELVALMQKQVTDDPDGMEIIRMLHARNISIAGNLVRAAVQKVGESGPGDGPQSSQDAPRDQNSRSPE